MSYITTPRKSPRKHLVPTPSSPQLNLGPFKWTKEHELALVYTLLDLTTKGVRTSFKGHYSTITENLNKRIERDGIQYSREQVKRKIEKLKKNWKEFTDLLTGNIATGVVWNEVDNTVVLGERQ